MLLNEDHIYCGFWVHNNIDNILASIQASLINLVYVVTSMGEVS